MDYVELKYKIDKQKPYRFIGSKVRGLLGYALKEEVCINPTEVCKDCFASRECIFYKFYEENNSIHPYRIDFKLNSSKYTFSLLLFGEAMRYKKSISNAVQQAFKEDGITKLKEKEKKLKLKKHSKIIKLEFLTPLRIKKQNRYATKDVELLDILLSIKKRYSQLLKLKATKNYIAKEYNEVSKNLKFQELIRKSNKQNRKMNLGGLMGEMVISNVSKEVYDLLKIGEVIGVGKSTVFGLGKIRVEDIG